MIFFGSGFLLVLHLCYHGAFCTLLYSTVYRIEYCKANKRQIKLVNMHQIALFRAESGKKFSSPEPSPSGERDTPSPHPTPFAASGASMRAPYLIFRNSTTKLLRIALLHGESKKETPYSMLMLSSSNVDRFQTFFHRHSVNLQYKTPFNSILSQQQSLPKNTEIGCCGLNL